MALRSFIVRYSGNSGTRPLEFTTTELSSIYVTKRVLRELPQYWPTYYEATVWEEKEGKDPELLAHYKAEIKVTVNAPE